MYTMIMNMYMYMYTHHVHVHVHVAVSSHKGQASGYLIHNKTHKKLTHLGRDAYPLFGESLVERLWCDVSSELVSPLCQIHKQLVSSLHNFTQSELNGGHAHTHTHTHIHIHVDTH